MDELLSVFKREIKRDEMEKKHKIYWLILSVILFLVGNIWLGIAYGWDLVLIIFILFFANNISQRYQK